MSTPFFSDKARVADLVRILQSWNATPFIPFTGIKGPGGGVDCARLIYEVLHEAGAIKTHDFHKERYAIRSPEGKVNLRIILRIVEHLGLRQVWIIDQPVINPMPGDVLIFTDNKERNHMGVACMNGKFWHCVKGPGVIESRVAEIEYSPHLAYIYRVFNP